MKESTSQRDLMVISSVMHARLKASTKIREKCFGRLSFADDAAVTTHSEDELQQLMNRGLSAWKKTPVTGQDVLSPPDIKIFNQQFDAFIILHTSVTLSR